MRRLLLYRTGDTHPEVVRDVGDYLQWFSRVTAAAPIGERAELVYHVAFRAPRPPADVLDSVHGILVTGSPLSLVEPAPWMDEAAGFVRDSAARGLPILGVCFGHQLVGYAFGGRVRENPRGWEAGTNRVELTEAGARDPLFHDLPAQLTVNQSHRDEVASIGERTTRLGTNPHSENQAIAIGDHVRGVQFHPEMDRRIIHRVIEQRRSILSEDAERTGRAHSHAAGHLLERASDTPEAERVIRNFIRFFVEKS